MEELDLLLLLLLLFWLDVDLWDIVHRKEFIFVVPSVATMKQKETLGVVYICRIFVFTESTLTRCNFATPILAEHPFKLHKVTE